MERHPAPHNPATDATPAPRAADQLPPARSHGPKRKRRHPAKQARRVATAVSASAAVLMVGGMAYNATAVESADSATTTATATADTSSDATSATDTTSSATSSSGGNSFSDTSSTDTSSTDTSSSAPTATAATPASSADTTTASS